MLLKRTLFCVFGVMECVYALRGKKKTGNFHILYIIVAPLYSAFLKYVDFYKAHHSEIEVCSNWPAIHCIVIGWIPQECDVNVTPLTMLWCHVPVRRDETKTIKPIINEAFVAFSEDIITDYNDSYSLFTHFAAPHKHNTICVFSAFVIVETAKQSLLYTSQNSHLNSQ